MATREERNLLQPVDQTARVLARRLVRGARFAAVSVLEPGSGYPLVSRTAVAADVDGAPVMLMSQLSAHTGALQADPRCSLLLGEPGRGDPLAHPRITVIGTARRVEREGAGGGDGAHLRVRRRFLARHPKAALYVDFGDFAFYKVAVERASLNGGFGRAYLLESNDLLSETADLSLFGTLDEQAVAHMNNDHADAVAAIAVRLGGAPDGPWQVASIDPDGLEVVLGDELHRIDFEQPVGDAAQLRATLVALARAARAPG